MPRYGIPYSYVDVEYSGLAVYMRKMVVSEESKLVCIGYSE